MTSTEKLVERGVEAIAVVALVKGRLADVNTIVSWMHDARNALREVEAKEARIAELEAALERSITAIDDWINTFAPEHCSEDRVAEAWDRIGVAGGTLAYIADVQQQNRRAASARVPG